MSRGDRTGPRGEGPETGRGAGWCHSGDRPGYESAPRFGRGRNWRNGNSGRRWLGYSRGQRDLRNMSRETESRTVGLALEDRLEQLISLIEKLGTVRKNKE